jgi:hypothetical protein
VERLYAGTSSSSSAPAEQARCGNCDDVDDRRADICLVVKEPAEKGGSPGTPQSVEREDGEDLDPYAGMFDDEQKKILEIKEQLEDPHQDTKRQSEGKMGSKTHKTACDAHVKG